MLNAILLSLALTGNAPVQLSLSQSGRYYPGDAVQVTVRPGADGYLLVLHADPDGRVRVLFPLDPGDDAFVRGGKDYELRSRGDRRTVFIADWSHGTGTILAALSASPLSPGAYAVNDHWDYRALVLPDDGDDETDLRNLAERIAPGGVEYDVMPYVIASGDGMSMGTSPDVVAVGVGVGGCWGCVGFGWGYGGWGFSIGWGWGWGGYWGYPSYPYYPYYPGYYPPYYPGYYPPYYPGYYPPYYPGYPVSPGAAYGTPYRSRLYTRTWDGQRVTDGGNVGVQGKLGGGTSVADGGYRRRDAMGVQGNLSSANVSGRRRDMGSMNSSASESRMRATTGESRMRPSASARATGRRALDANGYRIPMRDGVSQNSSRSGTRIRESSPSRSGTIDRGTRSGTRSGGTMNGGRPSGGSRPSAGGARPSGGGSRGAVGGGSRGSMGGGSRGAMGGGSRGAMGGGGGGGMRGGGYRGR